MTIILKCHPESQPRGSDVAGRPNTYEFTWYVEADEKLGSMQALDLGRGVVPAGLLAPVPQKGDALDITIGGLQLQDANAYAMEFYPEEIGEISNAYKITVVYRPPQVGQLEHPSEVNKNPEDMLPEAYFETQTSQHLITSGKIFIWNTSGQGFWEEDPGALGLIPLARGSGELFDPYPVQVSTHVLVVEYESTNPQEANRLNSAYNATTNTKALRLSGVVGVGSEEIDFSKYELAFYGAKQSRRYNRGWPTWTTQVRYAIDPNVDKLNTGWVERWPNAGNYVLSGPISGVDSVPVVPEDKDGVGRSAPYYMAQDGTAAVLEGPTGGRTADEELERRYRVLRDGGYEAETYFTEPP